MQEYQHQPQYQNYDPTSMTICCVPSVCHVGKPIRLENLSDTVKVICNNEQCQGGEYMHKVCFEQWEDMVLTYLRSTGRARSWSEKQRLQNLWTKKGYDLAYKACSCNCGKGHLRKDLDWIPPAPPAEDQGKKKKHRKKKNDKPVLTLTTTVLPNNVTKHGSGVAQQVPVNRVRSSSMSSMSSTSGSPPNYGACDHHPMSPTYSQCSFPWPKGNESIVDVRQERLASGNIFRRRQDYSSFNTLPRNKINSYHIQTEDEGNLLFDEKYLVLNALSVRNVSRINCIFCYESMIIFDRFPLIDGTFFISPQAYSDSAVPIKFRNSDAYLNAICMACLEGWTAILICKFCQRKWNGSHLILGTMYLYDVIAAIPCCEERYKCNNCNVLLPQLKVQYFSDFSQCFMCPFCFVEGYHFIKPLSTFMIKTNSLVV